MICATAAWAKSDSTRVYQGFSGGMMLHTGYLFGQDSRAPQTVDGVLCSPEGATFGIGGALHVNLWRLWRIGGEGFVSTLQSPLSTMHATLCPGSYVRSGWGGINTDICWRDLPHKGKWQLWPSIGASVGGGAMRSFYLLEGNQYDWNEEARSLFHKQSFCYLDPYIGLDWCLTAKVHLIFRLDWMLAFAARPAEAAAPSSPLLMPTGPRLYVGFMFCH